MWKTHVVRISIALLIVLAGTATLYLAGSESAGIKSPPASAAALEEVYDSVEPGATVLVCILQSDGGGTMMTAFTKPATK